MGKLIYWMNTSLDGYIEDAHGDFGWTGPNTEVNTYINEAASSIGTYLYGRKMYESMVYWETEYARHDPPPFSIDWARMWQAAEKIVFSRTLAEPNSARTRIEREFCPDAVRQLKADAERDMTVSGAGLAAHALRAGLVDEIHMLVGPDVIGGGKPFFPDGVRLGLELIEERAFGNGVVAVRYAVRSATV